MHTMVLFIDFLKAILQPKKEETEGERVTKRNNLLE